MECIEVQRQQDGFGLTLGKDNNGCFVVDSVEDDLAVPVFVGDRYVVYTIYTTYIVCLQSALWHDNCKVSGSNTIWNKPKNCGSNSKVRARPVSV